jgi:hypothetical protein
MPEGSTSAGGARFKGTSCTGGRRPRPAYAAATPKTHTHTQRDSILGLGKRKKGLWTIGGSRKGDYEFADDALVDEDWDGEAKEANDGEAAAGPAKV